MTESRLRSTNPPKQCSQCSTLSHLMERHEVMKRRTVAYNERIFSAINQSLERIEEGSVAVRTMVKAAVQVGASHENSSAINKLSSTYTTIVRTHLRLFQLTYNAEMRCIERIVNEFVHGAELEDEPPTLVVAPLAVAYNEIADANRSRKRIEANEAMEMEERPAKKRRLRGDRACIADGQEFLNRVGVGYP